MNLGALVVRLLLERAQFRTELAQTVQETNAAASKVQGHAATITGAVTDAVNGQTTAVQTATRALSVLGPVAATATAAALAVGVAFHQAQQETLAYEKAIILSGNAAGVTSGQLADMARRIDGVAGTQANAAAALASMTAGGKVAQENLEKVALAAIEMERATGQAIGETEKIFTSLGKDPVKASLRLNESMNHLTASTYAQIKAADNLGETERAVSIAQNAAADVLRDRAAQVEKNLGTMERAWRGVRDLAKEAWDAMLNIGRPDSSADQLSKAGERVAYLEKQVDGRRSRGLATGDLDGQLAAAKALHDTLRETAKLDERAAGIKSDLAAKDKARLELALALEQSASKQEKMAIAIAQANALADRSGASAAERAQLVNAAREKYAEKESKASRDARKELEREAATLSTLSGVNSDYQEQLKRLQLIRDKGNISEERYIELVTALIAKQPMAKQLMDEHTKATTAAEKAMVELAKARDKAIVAQAKETEKTLAAVTAQQEQNARLGLSKEAIAELDAAKLEMLATDVELQAIKVMDKNLDEAQYEILKRQAQAYRDLAQAKRDGAARSAAIESDKALEKAADKAAKEGEKASERIEQSLTDSLMRGFEAGKDMARNLRDTVVNMFKTMVLRPMVSAVVSPVAGAITGAMGLASAGQSAAGSAAGSMGSSLLGSAIGGMGAFGTGASYGAASLFANGLTGTLAAGGQMIGAGSVMSGLGTIAGALGPIALGIALLSSLIKKSTPHMGAASTYSEAGGLVSGADIYRSSGLADTRTYNAGVEQVTGNVAKAIGDTLNATARTFGKTAGYEITTAFADDTDKKSGAWGQLLIEQMGKTVLDWRDTQTSKWAPREFADGEAGSKEYLAEAAKSARDALVGAIRGVDWATGMLTALGDTVSLESLAQTVQQINAAKAAFVGFGQYMPAFASLADSAVSKIVQASGGVEALAGNMSVFVDGFYTDAEKLAINTENVRAAMERLGFEMPTTRDEYKALVQAQIALGDAGATTTAGLLSVAGAFAAVVPAAEQASQAVADMVANAMQRIASTRFDWQNKLLEQGGQGALAQQRTDARDLAELTAGLPPEMAAQVAAEFAANLALREQYESNERAIEAWRQGLAAAERDMQAAAEADRAAAQAALDAASGRASAAQRDLDTLQGVFDLLGDAIGTLRGQVTATAQMQAQQARDYIKQATLLIGSGTVPDQGKLQAAIRSASGGIDATVFASQFEEDRARLVLAGELSALQDGTAGQLTIAEQHLSLAQQGVTIAQQQLDALGVIASAISSLGGAQAAATGAKKEQWSNVAGNMVWASSGGAVGVKSGDDVDIYGKDGSRFLGSEAIAYVRNQVAANDEKSVYAAAVSSGISAKSLDALMGWPEGTSNDWAELNKLPKFAVGTNYVPRDMYAQIHEGEAIVPKAFNPWANWQGAGGNSAEVVAELRALRQQNARLEARLVSIEGSNKAMADLLDEVTDGGNAMRSEVMP